jgi:hypothetical protein
LAAAQAWAACLAGFRALAECLAQAAGATSARRRKSARSASVNSYVNFSAMGKIMHVELKNAEQDYVGEVGKFSGTDYGKQALRLTDVINEKTSALLTHVTIMIAVIGVFLTIFLQMDVARLFIIFLYVELIIYMLIACALLFCIFATSPVTFENKDFNRTMLSVMRRRRRIYNACLKVTIVITVVFVAFIGWKAATTFNRFYVL